MPNFRFKIFDPDSRSTRSGSLSGPNLESTRKYLEQEGYRVEWLQELNEPSKPVLQIKSSTKESFEINYDPGVYRPSLADLWQDKNVSKETLQVVWGLGFVLGLLLLVVNWRSTSPWSKVESSEEPFLYQFSVQAKLAVNEGTLPDPKSVLVTFVLPEIPFSQTFSGQDLLVGEDGELELKLELESTRPAGFGRLVVQGQSKPKSRKFSISGPKTDVDLGRLELPNTALK